MIQRSPAVDDLARRLLQHGAGGARDADSLAAAVEGVCRKLSDELETLVGRGGVAALLGRSVSLSKRESPSLAAVRLQADGPLLSMPCVSRCKNGLPKKRKPPAPRCWRTCWVKIWACAP